MFKDGKDYDINLRTLMVTRYGGRAKGVPLAEEHKQKIAQSNKGLIRSKQTRLNISNAKKGVKTWNTGLGKLYDGHTIEYWASHYNVRYQAIYGRIKRNGSPHPKLKKT